MACLHLRSKSAPLFLPAPLVLTLFLSAYGADTKHKAADMPAGVPVLWRDPVDIAERDLYYGPGGKAHEPHGTFKFLQEDMAGTNPKFEIVGDDGTKWKAKLGREARPETVASRLVWAVGYFANQDYFVPALRVEDLPKLRRGEKDVQRDGTVKDVRLKRHVKGEEKVGPWSWQKCPFTGTREWYGLRVLMAVLNNWDLKDINNSIYRVAGERIEDRYLISDLGASFGSTGLNRAEKGDLDAYRNSKWLIGESRGFVDFNVPSEPSVKYLFVVTEMVRRNGLIWLGRHIPVEDVRWMGSLLSRLSPRQIRDAFGAAGYSPSEVEAFSQEVEHRISVLNRL
jgi:hypothetical protein